MFAIRGFADNKNLNNKNNKRFITGLTIIIICITLFT